MMALRVSITKNKENSSELKNKNKDSRFSNLDKPLVRFHIKFINRRNTFDNLTQVMHKE